MGGWEFAGGEEAGLVGERLRVVCFRREERLKVKGCR